MGEGVGYLVDLCSLPDFTNIRKTKTVKCRNIMVTNATLYSIMVLRGKSTEQKNTMNSEYCL